MINFGSIKKFENISVRLVKYLDMENNKDMIFVGEKVKSPKEILRLFSYNELKAADEIQETQVKKVI